MAFYQSNEWVRKANIHMANAGKLPDWSTGRFKQKDIDPKGGNKGATGQGEKLPDVQLDFFDRLKVQNTVRPGMLGIEGSDHEGEKFRTPIIDGEGDDPGMLTPDFGPNDPPVGELAQMPRYVKGGTPPNVINKAPHIDSPFIDRELKIRRDAAGPQLPKFL